MQVVEILIRSISGYIFVFLGILLYFFYLKKSDRKQTTAHILVTFVFSYYLIGILTMAGINSLKSLSPRLVLIPFLDMVNGPVDTILNIVLFLPLGFFLPLLYKKCNRLSRTVLIGVLLSLSIEIIQMFGMGATDINDLMTNGVGTFLGYYIYRLLIQFFRKELCNKFQAIKINDYNELLFFIVGSFVVMLTIQPLIISSLFQLA